MRKRILISAVMLALLLLGIGLNLLRGKRRVLAPVVILAREPHFPANWDSGELDVALIQWEEVKTELLIKPHAAFRAERSASRTWTDRGRESSTPQIVQTVYLYANPVWAELHYWISRPEIAWRASWPNFSYHEHRPQRYPETGWYQGALSDRGYAVCALGAPSSCQAWFYWARCGQYLLSVFCFGPNMGIDTDLFGRIIASVETEMASQLGD